MGINIFFKRQKLIVCTLILLLTPPLAVETKDKPQVQDIDKVAYDKLINDLREHWQSPIMYLKKRGYLPDLKSAIKKKPVQRSHIIALGEMAPYIEIANDKRQSLDDGLANLLGKTSKVEDPVVYFDKADKQGFFSNMKDKFVGLFSSSNNNNNNNNNVNKKMNINVEKPAPNPTPSEFHDYDRASVAASLTKANAKINDLMKQLQLAKEEVKVNPKDDLMPTILKSGDIKNMEIINSKMSGLPKKVLTEEKEMPIISSKQNKNHGIIYYG